MNRIITNFTAITYGGTIILSVLAVRECGTS